MCQILYESFTVFSQSFLIISDTVFFQLPYSAAKFKCVLDVSIVSVTVAADEQAPDK